ncbi:MAG: rod shape-determining protein RodA [Firmicutes bacterium]|nr:rod shape-determining protein RodA [Bacillota bacterium]
MNKKILKNYDFTLLSLILGLSFFGVLMVTASYVTTDRSLTDVLNANYFLNQGMRLGMGLVALLVLSLIDYNELRRLAIPIYLFNLALLVLVIFRGYEIYESQRWIRIGFFNLQPSEIAKVCIIITLAILLSKEGRTVEGWFDLVLPFAHTALPMLLIFQQPDLGTSLVLIAILFGMLFVAGLRWLHLAVLSVAGVIAGVLAFLFVLKDYQIARLTIFLDPWQDVQGSGWQIIQSKVAIGAGQFKGRGLFQGIHNQLRFLPENHTDFIFAVIGEELGFVGSVAFLIVYMLLIWRVFKVAMEAKDSLGRYLCIGVASMLMFQLLVNVGMTISIMPVTGLPLPLISHGGSSFLATCMALGLVLSVSAHKDSSLF